MLIRHYTQRFVRTVAAPLYAAALALTPLHAAAEDEEAPPGTKLLVQVRAVHADGMVEPIAQAGGTKARVDPDIEDLAPQLQRLNYSSYRLVEQHDLVIPSRKKETIALRGGNMLTVRPLGVEGDKICVWLKWRDKSGMEVLDTRMRLVSGESMLTGTDHTPDSGMILAIKVRSLE